MSRIETRTVRPAKRRAAAKPRTADPVTEYRKLEARRARAIRQTTVRSDGVTRCSKCPPTRCCDDCKRINNARQVVGLIHPRGDHSPHPNNCLIATMSGPFRGMRLEPKQGKAGAVVTAHLKQLGGGWRKGLASLNGEVIYEGPATRSQDDAWAYAKDSAECIREGLRFEMLLDA